jgi:hypothetical protein
MGSGLGGNKHRPPQQGEQQAENQESSPHALKLARSGTVD